MCLGLSLADRLAQLGAPMPEDHEPVDNVAATEHYLDVEPGTMRTALMSVADPKYEGSLVARSQIEEGLSRESSVGGLGNGTDVEDSEEEDEDRSEEERGPQDQDLLENGRNSDIQAERGQDSPLAQGSASPLPATSRSAAETTSEVKDATRSKAIAVLHQSSIWDALLESRIRLQKSVTCMNGLTPHTVNHLHSGDSHRAMVDKVIEETLLLSDRLSSLQERLLAENENISIPPRKKQRISDEKDEELSEASSAVALVEECTHPALLRTVAKWSSKVQAVTPIASRHGAFGSSGKQPPTVLHGVDELLSNKHKLLERTRVYRGKERRTTYVDSEETPAKDMADTQLFDDTDFYSHLLQGIIGLRGGQSAVSEEWRLASQNKKRNKKKVDTKASKGRKLRYEVHNKLQNFMVPIPTTQGWHDEQADELFDSLLGRSVRSTDVPGLSLVGQSTLTPGFRIF